MRFSLSSLLLGGALAAISVHIVWQVTLGNRVKAMIQRVDQARSEDYARLMKKQRETEERIFERLKSELYLDTEGGNVMVPAAIEAKALSGQ